MIFPFSYLYAERQNFELVHIEVFADCNCITVDLNWKYQNSKHCFKRRNNVIFIFSYYVDTKKKEILFINNLKAMDCVYGLIWRFCHDVLVSLFSVAVVLLCFIFTVTLLIICLNPLPNKPWFLRVWNSILLKTLWEKEKLLLRSNFTFSHSVFYHFGGCLAIFIKLEIVVC